MKINDILKEILKRNRIILNLVIIVLINLAGMKLYFSFDLTKNDSYSISEISEEVVSDLADPLIIKVFFSPDLPAPYNTVQRYITDLMEEYSEAANGNFKYEIIDVEKEKDKASEFGIYPTQVRQIDSDQFKFSNAYMGLAIVHGDLIEKINPIDSTEGVEYRITSAIKKMTGKIDTLLNLENPVKVTLYAGSNLPISGLENIETKVADIVKKCSSENYDKLEFHYIDSAKDASALNDSAAYGLVKLEWPALNQGGKHIAAGSGILGVLIELNGRFEVINILSRSLFGQYSVGNLDNLKDAINKAIDSVINVNAAVGYITGHEERDLSDSQSAGGAANFKSMLSDMYEIKEIDLAKENIPEDISSIIINGPKKEFTDYELFKIDQFIMKGKSVFFLVDSFMEMNSQMNAFGGGGSAALPLNTGIEKLLSHYGVTVNKDIVLDKKCYKSNQQGLGQLDIYFYPIIEPQGLSRDNVISAYINSVVWVKGSSLSVGSGVKAAGISEYPLVNSSDESWLMQGRISFLPYGMTPPDKSQMAKRTLAELLEGNFVSYYKGKEIPSAPDAKKAVGSVTSTAFVEKALKPAKIIVAGSSEITLSNVVDKEGKALNSVFLHNAVDYLSGDNRTQIMRSKGLEYNPLDDTADYTKFIIKLLNIAGLPVLVIGAGLIVWRRRSLRKKKISEEYAV